MQGPPSVEYPVARSRTAGWLLSTLFVLWLLAQVAWAWALWPTHPSGAWWLGTVAGLLLAAYGVWAHRQSPAGRLAWERSGAGPAAQDTGGGRWVWYSPAYRQGTTVANVETVLDGQHTLLVRMANADGRVWWFWLERWRQPERWDGLRRALGYSRRRHAP